MNGAAVYARGGNKIPMDLIDGRLTAVAHRRLVQSAAEANMNMVRRRETLCRFDRARPLAITRRVPTLQLRVWGGGIWEPRAWFDACDELGVMLYL